MAALSKSGDIQHFTQFLIPRSLLQGQVAGKDCLKLKFNILFEVHVGSI